MKPPHGLDEIIREFGDWRPHVRPDGSISPSWEAITLGSVILPEPLPLGWLLDTKVPRVRFHYRLCGILQSVFEDVYAAGLWPALCTFDGGYAFRAKRGDPRQPSTHAWGIAIDLNAGNNHLGELPQQHPQVVEMFERVGFEWGGRWHHPDPMHWQFAVNY